MDIDSEGRGMAAELAYEYTGGIGAHTPYMRHRGTGDIGMAWAVQSCGPVGGFEGWVLV
jgi:hypothetical protein